MSSDPRRPEALIDALVAELTPVRRLLPPSLRTLGWLFAVAVIAVGLLARYGDQPMLQRWAGAHDLAWAAAGAVLTAVMVGLASAAAASASLLGIFHAFDAAATDLLTHALAVAIVVMVNVAMGGRLLSRH